MKTGPYFFTLDPEKHSEFLKHVEHRIRRAAGRAVRAAWQERIVRRIYGDDANLAPASFTVKRPSE